MRGANAELGYQFAKTQNYDFYTAAGPYYFSGDFGKAAWGGKWRLAGKYKEYIALEISDSYDSIFKNKVQGQLTLTFPFGPRSPVKKKNPAKLCSFYKTLSERLVQPVARDEIVVVDTHRTKSTAINPATGAPFVFWFVDNTSHSQGTFESPFNSLADAETASSPYEIIYVFPGDGTTTNMDSGFTMKESQRFLGASGSYDIQTTKGRVKIPSMATTLPVITNSMGSVVTVGNNNEVSGFRIQGFTAVGIDQPSGGDNLVITNNTFQGSFTNAITTINGNGIYVYNNRFSYNNNAVLISSANIADTTFSFLNNTIQVGSISMTLTDSSNVSVIYAGNNHASDGVSLTINLSDTTLATPHTISIHDNIVHSDSANIDLNLSNSSVASISAFNNSFYSEAFDNSISLTLSNQAGGDFTFQNNAINVFGAGIVVTDLSSSALTVSIQNSNIYADANNALRFTISDSGPFSASILDNSLQGMGSDNISMTTQNSATATFNISGNRLLGSEAKGISLQAQNSSSVNTSIKYNSISYVTTSSLTLSTANSATLVADVENNQFDSYGGTGSAVTVTQAGASTCLRFINNVASPIQAKSGGSGAYQFTGTAGTFNLEPYSNNVGLFFPVPSGVTNVPAGTCE